MPDTTETTWKLSLLEELILMLLNKQSRRLSALTGARSAARA